MKCVNSIQGIDRTLDDYQNLMLLEKVNPCSQLYFFDDHAFAIQYTQKLNIFNFINGLSLSKKINIIGMPFSVSKKGYYGSGDAVTDLLMKTKGFKIILNGDDDLKLPKGQTLSSFILENKYESFNDYISSMRSHYRYRVKKALKKGAEIQVRKVLSHEFAEAHYDLYLDTFNHSNDQLECLSIEFFRSFPADIHELSIDNKVIAFHQTVVKNDTLYFLFGGFNRNYLKSNDLYMNLLLSIVQLGINQGVKLIEFGQTAEDTKRKIGCIEVKKYLYLYHHNSLIRKLLEKVLPFFSYKSKGDINHVFKESYESHS